jgi:hypothetical protein
MLGIQMLQFADARRKATAIRRFASAFGCNTLLSMTAANQHRLQGRNATPAVRRNVL